MSKLSAFNTFKDELCWDYRDEYVCNPCLQPPQMQEGETQMQQRNLVPKCAHTCHACMSECTQAYIHMHKHKHIHIYASAHEPLLPHTHVHTYLHICSICTHIHASTYVCICVYTWACTCTHIIMWKECENVLNCNILELSEIIPHCRSSWNAGYPTASFDVTQGVHSSNRPCLGTGLTHITSLWTQWSLKYYIISVFFKVCTRNCHFPLSLILMSVSFF